MAGCSSGFVVIGRDALSAMSRQLYHARGYVLIIFTGRFDDAKHVTLIPSSLSLKTYWCSNEGVKVVDI